MLVLADLHWADAGSVELLGALLRRLPAAAVLVALAVRPRQAPERVAAALERAHRAGTLRRFEIGALTRDETRELLLPGCGDWGRSSAREARVARRGEEAIPTRLTRPAFQALSERFHSRPGRDSASRHHNGRHPKPGLWVTSHRLAQSSAADGRPAEGRRNPREGRTYAEAQTRSASALGGGGSGRPGAGSRRRRRHGRAQDGRPATEGRRPQHLRRRDLDPAVELRGVRRLRYRRGDAGQGRRGPATAQRDRLPQRGAVHLQRPDRRRVQGAAGQVRPQGAVTPWRRVHHQLRDDAGGLEDAAPEVRGLRRIPDAGDRQL